MVDTREYLRMLSSLNVAVPDSGSLQLVSNYLAGGELIDLIDKFQQVGDYFTLKRAMVGVPNLPEYASLIEQDALFIEIKSIVDFFNCPHTPFNPNDPNTHLMAIDLFSAAATLAQHYGEGFNLLLPNSIGIEVRQGKSSKLMNLGKGSGRIKLTSWQPQPFPVLPRVPNGQGGLCTMFDLILKPPFGPQANRGTLRIDYKK